MQLGEAFQNLPSFLVLSAQQIHCFTEKMVGCRNQCSAARNKSLRLCWRRPTTLINVVMNYFCIGMLHKGSRLKLAACSFWDRYAFKIAISTSPQLEV